MQIKVDIDSSKLKKPSKVTCSPLTKFGAILSAKQTTYTEAYDLSISNLASMDGTTVVPGAFTASYVGSVTDPISTQSTSNPQGVFG